VNAIAAPCRPLCAHTRPLRGGNVALTPSPARTVNGIRYSRGSFIYVANDVGIERQKAANNDEQMQPHKKLDEDWVAYILEIRASDEHSTLRQASARHRAAGAADGLHDRELK
jgi:hypothetical protein